MEDRKLSKMEQLIKNMRKSPIFRQLIPQEAGTGWPIPLRKNGKLYVTIPFYGFTRGSRKEQTILYPPFALITLEWSSHVPVEYVNLRFRNPWTEGDWEGQAGTFPHEAIARWTAKQYGQARSELLSMYDEMLHFLAQGSPIPVQWSERFGQLLRTLMEPSLKPYYLSLGQKFFERFIK